MGGGVGSGVMEIEYFVYLLRSCNRSIGTQCRVNEPRCREFGGPGSGEA